MSLFARTVAATVGVLALCFTPMAAQGFDTNNTMGGNGFLRHEPDTGFGTPNVLTGGVDLNSIVNLVMSLAEACTTLEDAQAAQICEAEFDLLLIKYEDIAQISELAEAYIHQGKMAGAAVLLSQSQALGEDALYTFEHLLAEFFGLDLQDIRVCNCSP